MGVGVSAKSRLLAEATARSAMRPGKAISIPEKGVDRNRRCGGCSGLPDPSSFPALRDVGPPPVAAFSVSRSFDPHESDPRDAGAPTLRSAS
jgi:hypothetical protein